MLNYKLGLVEKIFARTLIMTPTRPSDGVNLCTVDAHCHNGGKCGDYCPLIEGLGIVFKIYSLIYITHDSWESHYGTRSETISKEFGVHTKRFVIAHLVGLE